MAPLKVLVVGAGIAGNATSFWLAKLGHSVTVIERHNELRTNGLQLDLRGHGIAVMRHMGLEQAVREKCVPEEGVALVDSTGRQRAFFAANKTGKGAQSMTSEFEIMRKDLCLLLHDASVEYGAKYVFSTTVESYREDGKGIQVKFANGSTRTETFDLVVGCDGQGSRIRRLMLADGDAAAAEEEKILVTLPERFGYYTIDRPMQEGEKYIATGYLMPDKRFVLTRRHLPDKMQVYFRCEANDGPMDGVKKGDVKAEKEAFAEIFQNGGWQTDELVKALREGGEDFYCQYTGFIKLDEWSRGHVTLVGDAGYGCPPDGFGTSMALVGAYVLAGEVQRHRAGSDGNDGISAALSAYQTEFQPYMSSLQKGYSAEPSFFDKIPWNTWTVSFANNLAAIVSMLNLDKVAARFMPASDDEKGWKPPLYQISVRAQ